MTTLVVDELETTLDQQFTVLLNRRLTIEGVRIYIYMHNAPSGTFTLSLKEGATVHASKTFTSAEIKTDLSTSDNYAHLWKVISFSNVIHLSKSTYTLSLSSSGYSFSESSYLGWVKPHENIFNLTDGLNDTDFNNPRGFQLFERRKVSQ